MTLSAARTHNHTPRALPAFTHDVFLEMRAGILDQNAEHDHVVELEPGKFDSYKLSVEGGSTGLLIR
jgi:hypothetical protein